MQPKDNRWRLNDFHIIYATHESAIHASLMSGGGGSRRQLDKQGAIHATYIKTALALSSVLCARMQIRATGVWRQSTRRNINVTPPSVNSHKSDATDSDTLHIKRETALDLCPRRDAHASSFDLRVIGPLFRNFAVLTDSDSHTHTLSNEWFCRQFAPAWFMWLWEKCAPKCEHTSAAVL